ncbi:MAG: DUF2490 domain-containing protein [Chitinophagaceae bacterium]|nr:MAG: DUF2490 domain-containing protein [Chitinophagaceae bacterium]
MLRFLFLTILLNSVSIIFLKADDVVNTNFFPGIRVSKELNKNLDFTFRFRSLQSISEHKKTESNFDYRLIYNDFFGSVNYNFTENLNFTIGLTYRPVHKSENLIFPTKSIGYSHKSGKLEFQHRLKADYFFTGKLKNDLNRFRYRFRISYPFSQNTEINSPDLIIILEPMYYWNRKASFFIENRFFTGVSYRINPNHNIFSGVEYRSRFDENSIFFNNRLFLIFQWQINF